MTKENFVKFTCDNCGVNAIQKEGDGFPYKDGWCYIYGFNFQIKQDIPKMVDEIDGELMEIHSTAPDFKVNRVVCKDNHFCTELCMKKFLDKTINEAKNAGLRKE